MSDLNAPRPPRQSRKGTTSTGARKAASKSGRSRAREFALQALYQYIVSGNEPAAIDLFTRDLAGFHKADVAHYDDVLVAQDGSLIAVHAAAQPVMKVTHCAHHGTPFDLIRAAYHLGNRHVPIELQPDHLKIEPDHVLADMLRAMHLVVTEVSEPFEPENGAYTGHIGGHSHGTADHAPHGHTHGPGCDHAH